MVSTSARRGSVSVALLISIAGLKGAYGGPWLEVGDADELLPTAQVTLGVDPLTSISGTIFTSLDKDLYRIKITDPATFSAVVIAGGTLTNSQLFLFDSAGLGVYANDDVTAVDPLSLLPAGHPSGPSVAGIYYLAISGSDNDPANGGVEIFTDIPTGVQIPTIALPLDGWTPTFSVYGGTYTIALTGAGFATVPEPSTVLSAVAGAGLLGCLRVRRRFRR